MTLRLLADGLDPLDLDDWADGIVNTSVEVGGPTDRAVTFDRPDRDGDDDYTRYEGARAVTVGLAIVENPHTRRALVDRFAPFMHASKRITLELGTKGDAPRTLSVRPMPVPVQWNNPTGMELVWSFKTVGSPYWRGEDRTVDLTPKPPPPGFTFPLEFDLTFPAPPAGQTIDAFNGGSVDADWVWTITGPVEGPALRNEDTGDEVALPGLTLTEGQTAVVDSATRRVTVDGQARFSTVDHASSTWWRIPARQTVTVSMPVASYSDPAVGVLAYADTHHS